MVLIKTKSENLAVYIHGKIYANVKIGKHEDIT